MPCPIRNLLATIATLAVNERYATAQLIAALSELDARTLYLAEGCSSLFTYCTQVLHLSEHAAYGRIAAARAAQRYPVILTLLAAGAITLTTVTLLAPHLTDDHAPSLLERARHKSRREVEQLIAALRPQPPVPATIRKLPAPAPLRQFRASAKVTETSTLAPIDLLSPPPADQNATSRLRPAIVKPLAPESFKIQFTVSRDVHDKLRMAGAMYGTRLPRIPSRQTVCRRTRLGLRQHRAALQGAQQPRGQTVLPRKRSVVWRHVSIRGGRARQHFDNQLNIKT